MSESIHLLRWRAQRDIAHARGRLSARVAVREPVQTPAWRLGLLVARSVEKNADNGGDRRSAEFQLHDRGAEKKVSFNRFAEKSGTSAKRVPKDNP